MGKKTYRLGFEGLQGKEGVRKRGTGGHLTVEEEVQRQNLGGKKKGKQFGGDVRALNTEPM